MKSLKDYYNNIVTEGNDKYTLERTDIKYIIWEAPDKKVSWLDNNEKYQKIEYKYQSKDNELNIDFLLGFQNDTWKLWIGRIGSCSYDDDPYKSLNTDVFAKAVMNSLDIILDFFKKVVDDPQNYIQFYTSI